MKNKDNTNNSYTSLTMSTILLTYEVGCSWLISVKVVKDNDRKLTKSVTPGYAALKKAIDTTSPWWLTHAHR